jgi:hypothetical protein
MESFELECGGRCCESFETDEFYETIQVPKFHDFTGPKEELIVDPEAWFNGTSPCTSLNLSLTTHLPICPSVHLSIFLLLMKSSSKETQCSSTCICAGVIKKKVVAATATEVVFSRFAELQNP